MWGSRKAQNRPSVFRNDAFTIADSNASPSALGKFLAVTDPHAPRLGSVERSSYPWGCVTYLAIRVFRTHYSRRKLAEAIR